MEQTSILSNKHVLNHGPKHLTLASTIATEQVKPATETDSSRPSIRVLSEEQEEVVTLIPWRTCCIMDVLTKVQKALYEPHTIPKSRVWELTTGMETIKDDTAQREAVTQTLQTIQSVLQGMFDTLKPVATPIKDLKSGKSMSEEDTATFFKDLFEAHERSLFPVEGEDLWMMEYVFGMGCSCRDQFNRSSAVDCQSTMG